MKHIFVSIQEFLQNGGALEPGRQFFTENIIGRGNYSYDRAGEFKHMNGDTIIMQGLSASHPALPHVFYVKIEVTPIYK